MEHTSGHMLIEKLSGVNRKGTCSIVLKWRPGMIKGLGTECQKTSGATENAEGQGRKHKEAVSLPTLGCEKWKFLGKWLERSTRCKSTNTIKCAIMYITKSQPSLWKREKKKAKLELRSRRRKERVQIRRLRSKSGELADMGSCQTQFSLDRQMCLLCVG